MLPNSGRKVGGLIANLICSIVLKIVDRYKNVLPIKIETLFYSKEK